MTATPIPRTLALTLYGDLDVSVIDEMPPGRKPIKTTLGGAGRARRSAYALRARADRAGRPGVRHLPAGRGVGDARVARRDRGVRAAAHARSSRTCASACCTAACRRRRRTRSCSASATGEPTSSSRPPWSRSASTSRNATVMLIEGADRFGLAQLHQFRGRVGRGARPELLPAARRQPVARGAAAAELLEQTQRRLRAGRGRPAAARPRRLLRHAPERPARAASGPPHRHADPRSRA